MASAPFDFAAKVRALRRMLERHRERIWTKSGSLRRPRRRAVKRRYSRRILRTLANAHSLRGAARRLGCAPSTLSRNTDQRELCGVMLPTGRVKRCPACRLQAQRERRIRLRLAHWQARVDRGTFPLR